MYGLIGKMTAVAGQRDALAAILLESTGSMPGCLSYIIATDPTDPDALWITEVWDTQASHQASLSLPAVQAAIRKGRPLIAGFSDRVETAPLGGHGLQGTWISDRVQPGMVNWARVGTAAGPSGGQRSELERGSLPSGACAGSPQSVQKRFPAWSGFPHAVQ